MSEPNNDGDPRSPEREKLHENDMNGIMALLQLSAGKKSARKRRDVINSPSYFGSPGKRSRGYSPGGVSLSPSSRVMLAPPMPPFSPQQMGLQNLPGLQMPSTGMSGISGMLHLHEVPPWMEEAQKRVERATASLETSTGPSMATMAVAGTGANGTSVAGEASTSKRVASKRAEQREARREAKRQAHIQETLRERGRLGVGGSQAVERDTMGGGGTEGPRGIGHSTNTVGNPGVEMLRDPKKGDRHGSLIAFFGREFLYSDVDERWYMEGRAWMDGVLEDIGFDTKEDVMLTKAEWTALRSSMKGAEGVRRLSRKFMHDSRAELYAHREREAADQTFSVGQAVTAIHPGSQEIQDGVILTLAGKDFCRVQFDRVDLGVHLVSMSMLRRADKTSHEGLISTISNVSGVNGTQRLPNVHPNAQALHSPASGQHHPIAPVAMPLSYMLGAFMQQTSGMRTPSPEKVPQNQSQRTGLSPSELVSDTQHIKLETGITDHPTIKAMDFNFDEEAIKKMPNKRRYVLQEMHDKLRAACTKEQLERVDKEVSHMYLEVTKDIDTIKEGKSLLGGELHPEMACVGREGHQQIRAELSEHIRQLMSTLVLLERTPSLFDMFLRGLELLAD